jgi:hypothetical protein
VGPAAKLAAASLFGFVTVYTGPGAQAGGRGAWFESLKMPGSNASCCGVGDCHRTEAEWRDGQWWAIVNGNWLPVPDSRVLASPVSIDGSAYVCFGSPEWIIGGFGMEPPIYCFVPPIWGM